MTLWLVIAWLTAVGLAQTPIAAEQELVALERAWGDAELKGDGVTVARILGDEFINTDEDGVLQNKSHTVNGLTSGNVKVTAETIDDFQVRIYGDVAVVIFRVVQTGTSEGKDISGPIRLTDVFVRRDGRWQCVAEQATRIAKQ